MSIPKLVLLCALALSAPCAWADTPPPASSAPQRAAQPPASGTPPPIGSWTPINGGAPEDVGTALLLTDGTVMVQGADNGFRSAKWYRLTPDSSGNYVNGSWTQLASMNQQRLYYASAVMQNGQVFVAGGEYSDAGSETNTAEIYDPLANAWTAISGPPGWANIGDAPLTDLASGQLLLGSINTASTALYSYASNSWATGGSMADIAAEESWTLLPDNSVLTVDCAGQSTNSPNGAERYIPGSNSWTSAQGTPDGSNLVEASSEEIGPGVLLPDGRALYVGATGHSALYSSSNGTWQSGPDLPYVLDVDSSDQGSNTSNTYNTYVQAQCKDAPGCLEVNGKVLIMAGPTGYNNNSGGNEGYPGGQYFFEYTPDPNGGAGSFASVPSPYGYVSAFPAYQGRILALPNGQALLTNFTNQPYVYTPDSGPNSAWQPTIYSTSLNADGTYNAVGTQFNGLSQASAYGDDVSNATNYPLVRLTDGSGNVSYARTFNHSTMGVATGGATVSTFFTLPPSLAPGNYSLAVVANGIASVPYTFSPGDYVNAADAGNQFQNGSQPYPYGTVNQGVNAAINGGVSSYVHIQGGSYPENLTINKAVTLVNNGGGVVTIGN